MSFNQILFFFVAFLMFDDACCDSPSNDTVNQNVSTNQTVIPAPALSVASSAPISPFGFVKPTDDWIAYFKNMRSQDGDSCVSRFICEAISQPWNFGDYGYKVQRFFFMYMPDASNEAGIYYKNVASTSYFTWNCATRYPSCKLTSAEIKTLASGQQSGGFP